MVLPGPSNLFNLARHRARPARGGRGGHGDRGRIGDPRTADRCGPVRTTRVIGGGIGCHPPVGSRVPALPRCHVLAQPARTSGGGSAEPASWRSFRDGLHVGLGNPKMVSSSAARVTSGTRRSPSSSPNERVAWKYTDGKQNAGVVTFHRLDDQPPRVMVRLDWAPEGIKEKVGEALGAESIAELSRRLVPFKIAHAEISFDHGTSVQCRGRSRARLEHSARRLARGSGPRRWLRRRVTLRRTVRSRLAWTRACRARPGRRRARVRGGLGASEARAGRRLRRRTGCRQLIRLRLPHQLLHPLHGSG